MNLFSGLTAADKRWPRFKPLAPFAEVATTKPTEFYSRNWIIKYIPSKARGGFGAALGILSTSIANRLNHVTDMSASLNDQSVRFRFPFRRREYLVAGQRTEIPEGF